MNILITGGTGLIGRALVQSLIDQEHRVAVVSRGVDRARKILAPGVRLFGNIDEVSNFEPLDVIINLAGEPIADEPWTETRKRRIIESRVGTTRQCARLVGRLETPPRVFLSASAIGYYGHGEEECTESSPAGEGFLPEVARRWEAEALGAGRAGTRVCLLRIGVVLAPDGGAYTKMLPPFRFKVAGRLGNGRQWFSWIHRDDVLGAIHHIIAREDCRGPFNLTAPSPVTNAAFTRILGGVERAWVHAPVPAWLLRTLLGDMADDLLLKGQRVAPRALLDAGYAFKFPDLKPALEALKKSR